MDIALDRLVYCENNSMIGIICQVIYKLIKIILILYLD